MQFPKRELPPGRRVRQRLNGEHIPDVRGTTRAKLLGAGLAAKIRKRQRIAITAGSRGMGGFLDLLGGIIDALHKVGAIPIIVPAMGSHGGASAEGQERLLKRLGVRPELLKAEIRATMETVPLGTASSGAVAHFDSIAHDSDGVIVLGRVKTHPENTEGIASGLLKMTAIGLGKQIGAQEAHSHGLWESVESVPRLTLATGKILFGVAVVENGFRQPAAIEVVPGNYEAFHATDTRLLKTAKQHFAHVPFDDLDLLVIDQIGKNISGTGMDLNVIGTWRVKGGEKKPHYKRLVALTLTPESMGNGLGIGLADFTTERFLRAYNSHDTYINLLTATEPGTRNTVEGPVPLALPNDRQALEVGLYSSLAKHPRICRIESTARLDEFWISESLAEEASRGGLEVIDESTAMQFDAEGNLFSTENSD